MNTMRALGCHGQRGRQKPPFSINRDQLPTHEIYCVPGTMSADEVVQKAGAGVRAEEEKRLGRFKEVEEELPGGDGQASWNNTNLPHP